MTDLKCPECGAPVPGRASSGTIISGGVESAAPQTATCPECSAKLIRNPESAVEQLQRWRVDDGPLVGD
jgi:endogenous inhibitor of DNA gyrase (YacG/DUF329 family)